MAVISTFSSVTGTFVLEKVATTKPLTDLQSVSNTMQRINIPLPRCRIKCQSFAEPQENADGFRSSSNAVEGSLS